MKLKLGIDKLYHFEAGIVIFVISCLFLSPILSMIPVTVIAAVKEFYDWKSKKGNPDIWDFLFTVLGGISVLIFVI